MTGDLSLDSGVVRLSGPFIDTPGDAGERRLLEPRVSVLVRNARGQQEHVVRLKRVSGRIAPVVDDELDLTCKREHDHVSAKIVPRTTLSERKHEDVDHEVRGADTLDERPPVAGLVGSRRVPARLEVRLPHNTDGCGRLSHSPSVLYSAAQPAAVHDQRVTIHVARSRPDEVA